MKTQAVLYWIRLPEHTDPKTEGYIGVSKRYEARLLDHYNAIQKGTHKNPHLVNAVNKHGWEGLIKEAIYTGEEHECYEVQSTYRPFKEAGWNIAPGGHRGPGWLSGRKKGKNSTSKQKVSTDKKRPEEQLARAEARKIRLETREQKRLDKISAIEEKRKAREIRRKERELKKQKQLEERQRRLQKKIDEGTVNQVVDLSERPICASCNANRCAINYWRKGKPHYRKICDSCGKKKVKNRPSRPNWEKAGYKKKDTCDICGFKSILPSQITVYHIDGNLNNVTFSNLRSICLNCVEVVKKQEVTWKRGDLQVDY